MPDQLAISFPHMGEYSIVFTQLMGHLFPTARVFPAPPMTQKTVELGSRHSPDFVCSPFKYNLGNYIEALEQGANVLFQTGMGCRYGYYGELQEQILRDLGYQFQFLCLSRERAQALALYRSARELGCTLPLTQMLSALLLACESIRAMDRYEYWMREEMGFQSTPGSCEAVRKQLFEEIAQAHSLQDLQRAKNPMQTGGGSHPDRQAPKPFAGGHCGGTIHVDGAFQQLFCGAAACQRRHLG